MPNLANSNCSSLDFSSIAGLAEDAKLETVVQLPALERREVKAGSATPKNFYRGNSMEATSCSVVSFEKMIFPTFPAMAEPHATRHLKLRPCSTSERRTPFFRLPRCVSREIWQEDLRFSILTSNKRGTR